MVLAQYLVRVAHRHGVLLFVDTDGELKYYPGKKASEALRRLLQRHYYELKQWLIADAVTIE